jgi:hypothetical protein
VRHYHVYGRTRSGQLKTVGSWWTRPEAVADMKSLRACAKNGVEFMGTFRFRVGECGCPMPSYLIQGGKD